MSWMDSWSRPKKSATTPPPLYLTNGEDVPYCWSCGRVIGSRRSQSAKSAAATAKYCSDRCKRHKPSTAPGSLDQRIEEAFILLLEGKDTSALSSTQNDNSPDTNPPASASGSEATDFATRPAATTTAQQQPLKGVIKGTKGDPRIIVSLSAVEDLLFAHHKDPEKTFGRKRNRARRGVADDGEWRSVDMVDRHASDDSSDSEDDAQSADERPRTDDDEEASLTDTSITSTTSAKSSSKEADGGVPLPEMVDLKLDPHIRPPQSQSDVNGSIGGEKSRLERHDETPEELVKRRIGQRKAEERELVRCVARRGVVFGFSVKDGNANGGHRQGQSQGQGQGKGQGKGAKGKGAGGSKPKGKGKRGNAGAGGFSTDEEVEMSLDSKDTKGVLARRKCEAVMQGAVVEPSFAKGDWAIRWRED